MPCSRFPRLITTCRYFTSLAQDSRETPLRSRWKAWTEVRSACSAYRLADFEPDRQVVRTVDVQRFARFPRAVERQFQLRETRHQVGQRNARFHSRERGADAEMGAVSERDVRIGVAFHIEALGVGEDARVSVGGADHR